MVPKLWDALVLVQAPGTLPSPVRGAVAGGHSLSWNTVWQFALGHILTSL